MQLSCEGNNITARWLRTPHLLRWKTLSGDLCCLSSLDMLVLYSYQLSLFYFSTPLDILFFFLIFAVTTHPKVEIYNDLQCIELWRRKHSSRLASLDIASGSNTREIGQRRRITSPVISRKGNKICVHKKMKKIMMKTSVKNSRWFIMISKTFKKETRIF